MRLASAALGASSLMMTGLIVSRRFSISRGYDAGSALNVLLRSFLIAMMFVGASCSASVYVERPERRRS